MVKADLVIKHFILLLLLSFFILLLRLENCIGNLNKFMILFIIDTDHFHQETEKIQFLLLNKQQKEKPRCLITYLNNNISCVFLFYSTKETKGTYWSECYHQCCQVIYEWCLVDSTCVAVHLYNWWKILVVLHNKTSFPTDRKTWLGYSDIM